MLNHLTGRLIEKNPASIVVECHGVGYLLNISLNTYSKITAEENIRILVHLQITEDAHTLYGFADEDGCPDTVPTQAKLVGDRIEIKEQVQFRLGKADVDPLSYDLLRQVADILRSRPKQRIEVQGHTDNRGNPRRNLELSQQRADKVREFLIHEGIAAERLTARGYGALRPRVSNQTQEGRAENRRVEFVLTGEAK